MRLWQARGELRARDAEILRDRWDTGKASGLAGEAGVRGIVAQQKTRKRETRLAALDATIDRGIADANAGRVKSASAVFDRLEAKYKN
jgi:hypothetical protein